MYKLSNSVRCRYYCPSHLIDEEVKARGLQWWPSVTQPVSRSSLHPQLNLQQQQLKTLSQGAFSGCWW